ncbi:class I SAM-dependent methyltransferase [Synechococcus sp. PCC 7336]|uniref:class I SAM-dependent methyltransferase n=1 Tax=Synechococcus sp. PCC 7336 TaxID=195250 RepID=UPI000372A670|nr:class I SAM-dependent methyltransferase [Synechococcus sp. PCC 7336]
MNDIVARQSIKQQFFDRWATVYDCPFTSFFYQVVHELLLARVRLGDRAEVLDLGCGTGRFLDRLAKHYPRVRSIGLDLSPQMLCKARGSFRHRPRPIFVRGSADAMPFGDGQFDAVFCTFSFLHYLEPKAVFREIARVLRPGGSFYWVDGKPIFERGTIQWPVTPGGVRLYGPNARERLGAQAGLQWVEHPHLLGSVLMSAFAKPKARRSGGAIA